MTYTLIETGRGKYTIYFFSRRHKNVYAINTNGDSCVAKIAKDYQAKFERMLDGLQLRNMNTRLNELPKYITNKLQNHIIR